MSLSVCYSTTYLITCQELEKEARAKQRDTFEVFAVFEETGEEKESK